MEKKITLPITDEDIKNLKAGDSVLLTGSIITGRDAAHKRLYELIQKGEKLPVDIKGELIYYVGPAPAKPGYAVGPAGPTSSYRMDKYAPSLLDLGLKGMIGKGARNKEVVDAIVRNKGVYLVAIGGAAALIAKSIKSEEILCYEEKEATGAKIEVLLLKRGADDVWETLVKPGRKAKPGTRISFGDGLLVGEVVDIVDEGNTTFPGSLLRARACPRRPRRRSMATTRRASWCLRSTAAARPSAMPTTRRATSGVLRKTARSRSPLATPTPRGRICSRA